MNLAHRILMALGLKTPVSGMNGKGETRTCIVEAVAAGSVVLEPHECSDDIDAQPLIAFEATLSERSRVSRDKKRRGRGHHASAEGSEATWKCEKTHGGGDRKLRFHSTKGRGRKERDFNEVYA